VVAIRKKGGRSPRIKNKIYYEVVTFAGYVSPNTAGLVVVPANNSTQAAGFRKSAPIAKRPKDYVTLVYNRNVT